MFYFITPLNEVLPFINMCKKTVEIEPTFVEEFYPKCPTVKRTVAYSNYKYQIINNDDVIFETTSVKLRNKVNDNILDYILQNRYETHDVFININDILYATEKMLYEEKLKEENDEFN